MIKAGEMLQMYRDAVLFYDSKEPRYICPILYKKEYVIFLGQRRKIQFFKPQILIMSNRGIGWIPEHMVMST